VRRAAAVLALALGAAPVLHAQSPDSLVAAGVRAFQDLEFDVAAGYLGRATSLLASSPDTALRVRALTYLGATEIYRQQPDSAAVLFRNVVRLDPSHRIDRLVFPPEVTSVFDAARRATPAVAIRMVAEQRFQAGQPEFVAMLHASTFHDLAVAVLRPDAAVVRRVYTGAIADSLEVVWDGRTADGDAVASGRYVLAVTSLDAAGEMARTVRLPLTVSASDPDTLPTPVIPSGDLLPERTAATGGLEALLGGILLGTGVAAGPSVIASDASLSAGRFAVGGAVVAIGVAGFVMGRSARDLPENVAVNDSVRAAWQVRREEVAAENARRRASVDLRIRVGPGQVIERTER
jgi:hypothetical protein